MVDGIIVDTMTEEEGVIKRYENISATLSNYTGSPYCLHMKKILVYWFFNALFEELGNLQGSLTGN